MTHGITPFATEMFSNTPVWVWLVLGYLIFISVKALHPRTIFIPKLFMIPFVLSVLKYRAFLYASFAVWIAYFVCLFLAFCFTLNYLDERKVRIVKKTFSVVLPGTYQTGALLMTFFVLNYIFGYLGATDLDLYKKLQIIEMSLSAALSGYFLGQATGYFVIFKKRTHRAHNTRKKKAPE